MHELKKKKRKKVKGTYIGTCKSYTVKKKLNAAECAYPIVWLLKALKSWQVKHKVKVVEPNKSLRFYTIFYEYFY